MTLQEAVDKGVARLRQPQWVNDTDYIKIDILKGNKLGPWFHLYSPINKQIGNSNPLSHLWINFDNATEYNMWEEYKGPIDKAENIRITTAIPIDPENV